ncbi:hypothetical protein [Nostoc linckia]|uniref:hypothetical protein n=1 Tax=Nostoc linckia TaxID=92942 RepID=UPI001C5585C1|nr:hypothetical protein [Nostoc linckia]
MRKQSHLQNRPKKPDNYLRELSAFVEDQSISKAFAKRDALSEARANERQT